MLFFLQQIEDDLVDMEYNFTNYQSSNWDELSYLKNHFENITNTLERKYNSINQTALTSLDISKNFSSVLNKMSVELAMKSGSGHVHEKLPQNVSQFKVFKLVICKPLFVALFVGLLFLIKHKFTCDFCQFDCLQFCLFTV